MSRIIIGNRTWLSTPGQTRNEFIAENISVMGKKPRLRLLVTRLIRNGRYVDTIMQRIHSAKVNRVRSNRSLTSEERLSLADQKQRFAELLSKLPPMPLP